MALPPDAIPLSGLPPDAVPLPEEKQPESWDSPTGKLAAFGYGARRALERAGSFLGGPSPRPQQPGEMAGGPMGAGAPEAQLQQIERAGGPAMAAHPNYAEAGGLALQVPAGAVGGELVGGMTALPWAVRTLAQAVPGYVQGAAFASPEDRSTAGKIGAVVGPVGSVLGDIGGKIFGGALNRARGVAARFLGVDPRAAMGAFKGITPEESMRQAGERAIGAGMMKPGMEMGERALAMSQINKPLQEELKNSVLPKLNEAGARINVDAMMNDLRDVTEKHFMRPGSEGIGPIMVQGRQTMERLMGQIENNPSLFQGSRFSHFMELKRTLQGNWSETTAPGVSQEIDKALNDAASVVRRHTEEAAMQANPALGARLKDINSQLNKNIPLEQGAQDMAIALQSRPEGPGVPHIASSPVNLAHRVVWGQILHGSAPYRVGLDRAMSAIYNLPGGGGQRLLQGAGPTTAAGLIEFLREKNAQGR